MPLKNSVWPRSLRWLPNRTNERFEQMMAAGCQLEQSLNQHAECRRICFSEKNEGAIDCCKACTLAIEEAQRRFDKTLQEMRESI